MRKRKLWQGLFTLGVKTPVVSIIIVLLMIFSLYLLTNTVSTNVYAKTTGILQGMSLQVKLNPQVHSKIFYDKPVIWYFTLEGLRYEGTIIRNYSRDNDQWIEVSVQPADIENALKESRNHTSDVSVELWIGRRKILNKLLKQGDAT